MKRTGKKKKTTKAVVKKPTLKYNRRLSLKQNYAMYNLSSVSNITPKDLKDEYLNQQVNLPAKSFTELKKERKFDSDFVKKPLDLVDENSYLPVVNPLSSLQSKGLTYFFF
jgi:hypothetical protein